MRREVFGSEGLLDLRCAEHERVEVPAPDIERLAQPGEAHFSRLMSVEAGDRHRGQYPVRIHDHVEGHDETKQADGNRAIGLQVSGGRLDGHQNLKYRNGLKSVIARIPATRASAVATAHACVGRHTRNCGAGGEASPDRSWRLAWAKTW